MSQIGTVTSSAPAGVVALGRRSITYALGGLAYKGVALLAIPILARLLTPAELGLLDLAAVAATVVGLVVVLGSDQGAAFLEPRTDQSAGVWSSALAMIAVLSALAIAVAAVTGGWIAAQLTGDAANGPVFAVAALYGGVVALTMTALNAIRLHSSARVYALASFIIVTAEMAAALTVAWQFDSPVTLMVLAWAGAALIVVLPLLVRYIPSFAPPRGTTVRRLAVFGAPLVPAAVAWLVGDAWIRGTIAQQLDLSAVGEYGIAFRIASVVGLAVTGFGVAWQPYIFRSLPDEVHGRASALLPYVMLGLGVTAIVLTLLAPEIIALVAGDAYAGARAVVAPLSAGAVGLGAFVLVSAVVAASGSTRRIALAAGIGVAVQVASAPLLVGMAGLGGAGIASLLGYVVAVVILVAGARRVVQRPGGPLVTGVLALVALGLLAAVAAAEMPLVWRSGLAVLAMTLAVAGALVLRIGLRSRTRSGA